MYKKFKNFGKKTPEDKKPDQKTIFSNIIKQETRVTFGLSPNHSINMKSINEIYEIAKKAAGNYCILNIGNDDSGRKIEEEIRTNEFSFLATKDTLIINLQIKIEERIKSKICLETLLEAKKSNCLIEAIIKNLYLDFKKDN